MNDYERRILQRLKDDYPHYAAKCLKIRTKNGNVSPFTFNRAQMHTHERLQEQLKHTGKVRAVILKGRQQGLSTYIGGRFYHKVTHGFGLQSFILAHEQKATNNLYEMVQRYYENTPEIVKPIVTRSNAKELLFGRLDSGYKLGTSENKGIGRSSTIHLLHWSEVAFSSHTGEHSKGVMQAVPNAPGTEIILESTANGVGGFFHHEWQKAQAGISDFIAIFIPWFWQDEYFQIPPDDFMLTADEETLKQNYGLSDGQVYWRRKKIIELSVNGEDGNRSFKQEYPCNANEAFQLTGEDSFIDSEIVASARAQRDVEKYGALVIGVDPARFGDDRTAIIKRRGRVAYDLEMYTKKDTMEVAGMVHIMIEKYRPAKVMIDVGGLGAGVVDRLNELGHGDVVVAVNAGSKPFDGTKYKNKRAEMWADCKGWLEDVPIQIPDDDALHSDLCGIKYHFDSNSRLVMESKEEMKKRGIRSSDCADALCLTFALPPSAYTESMNSSNRLLDSMAQSFDAKINALNKSRR